MVVILQKTRIKSLIRKNALMQFRLEVVAKGRASERRGVLTRIAAQYTTMSFNDSRRIRTVIAYCIRRNRDIRRRGL